MDRIDPTMFHQPLWVFLRPALRRGIHTLSDFHRWRAIYFLPVYDEHSEGVLADPPCSWRWRWTGHGNHVHPHHLNIITSLRQK